MAITIKNTAYFAVTGLFITSLAACEKNTVPWAEESPWADKHAAEQQEFSAESGADTSLNDPVLLADSEPVMETEMVELQEPEMAPAPELIAPVIVVDEPATEIELTASETDAGMDDMTTADAAAPAEQDIMAMSGDYYAVQVYAGKTEENVSLFKSNKNLDDLIIVKTERPESIIYVLVDVYPDLTAAKAAASELEVKIGSKPWVRPVSGLQKIAMQ